MLDAETAPSSIDPDDDDAVHPLEPFLEDGIPVYRYPMMSQSTEILIQETLGFASSVYAAIAFSLPATSAEHGPYVKYAALSGMSNALIVQMVGRANGSRGSVLGTLLGGVAGGAVGGSWLWLGDHGSVAVPYDVLELSTWLLPTVGAIAGYHLLSSWKTEQSKENRSIASSPLFDALLEEP